MRYQPIENRGIVGNMHSAALVSLDGSVGSACRASTRPACQRVRGDPRRREGGRFRRVQAFTHFAPTSAAFDLDRPLAGRAD